MFGKETKYWQEQYKKGNIPQEWLNEMRGESLSLLDGDAEKIAKRMITIMLIGIIALIGLAITLVITCRP